MNAMILFKKMCSYMSYWYRASKWEMSTNSTLKDSSPYSCQELFYHQPTNQPTYLILLDTAQLCQLAGDTQCVAKQNQFNTLNLITKLDSTGKTWTITGQVENRVSKTQNSVQVLGYFYDSKGNSVGGPYKGIVNPTVLKSHQLGAFSMKPSTSIMKGTPIFIRLEYQST